MKRIFSLLGLSLLGLLFFSQMANAEVGVYELPDHNSRLIGQIESYTVPHDGHPLEAIAAQYKIGLIAMLEANPGTDPFLPKPGSVLTIPSQMILPDTPRKGIVINIAELRLYYYPEHENKVYVFPIGIGQLGRDTPVMTTFIKQKIPNPTWTPTENIRKVYASEGVVLPAVMPAGPDNPMGLFAMRLAAGRGEYLIHGTNADFGIGMRVSSGCIRLRPDDIDHLFHMVPLNTRVQIINEPIKVTVEPNGEKYIEVHQPLSRKANDDPQTLPIHLNNNVVHFLKAHDINEDTVDKAIIRRSGLPTVINNKIASKEVVSTISSDSSAEQQPTKTVTNNTNTSTISTRKIIEAKPVQSLSSAIID